VLRFDVELYGIPYNPDIGHEVTVNFIAPEIKNAGVFYTDSSGLAMQKRVLNYRPTWDLTYPGGQNITANYYPIASAIAIQDGDWQMTVMNSRPQGGSVINEGRIELMQNRRCNLDDWRGMGEALNETYANKNGISVPAQYYVQLFNNKLRPSLQRTMQLRMDQPAQYFFSFEFEEIGTQSVPAIVSGDFGEVLRKNGLTSEMKLEMFANGPNELLMRIENIGDTFDSDGQLIDQSVNVIKLASDIMKVANDGEDVGRFAFVKEMSLTANQSYRAMHEGRLKWKTVDDIEAQEEPKETFENMRFQQQRIRTFAVKYVSLHADF